MFQRRPFGFYNSDLLATSDNHAGSIDLKTRVRQPYDFQHYV